MKLLLDMGIAAGAAVPLRRLGHDAEHLEDRHESRLEDREIVSLARVEPRIVVTHDLDFTDLLVLSGATAPSVITFRLLSMRPDRVWHGSWPSSWPNATTSRPVRSCR